MKTGVFKPLSILLLTCIIAGLLLSSCGVNMKSKKLTGDEAKSVLIDHPWMDKFPNKPTMSFTVYIFTREKIGVHDRALSSYKHLVEVFAFRVEASTIGFLFPHDVRKSQSGYAVEEIRGEGPFNLKMTLEKDPQNEGKPSVFYSNTKWRIKDKKSLPETLKFIPTDSFK